jgi:hypothetical protein
LASLLQLQESTARLTDTRLLEAPEGRLKKVEIDARSALAGNLVREEDWDLKKKSKREVRLATQRSDPGVAAAPLA